MNVATTTLLLRCLFPTYCDESVRVTIASDTTGIAVAYTMGGASVKIQNNESDGSSTATTYQEDRTEVNLSLAF